MKILGIDTSCDETAIAVLKVEREKFTILSNVIASQIPIHKKYGGVYPALAKREHQENLTKVLSLALQQAHLLIEAKPLLKKTSLPANLNDIFKKEPILFQKISSFLLKYKKPDIRLLAVTIGPGLEPCLWTGVNFARALSCFWKIPIVPINHIEAHALVNYLNGEKIKLPALALVVSGGHTQLFLIKKIGKYQILGETRDDAAGECLDKCAKILGFEYPGGPIISKLAQKAQNKKINFFLPKLPRPMINSKDYDFSFSGLKTALLYYNKKKKIKSTLLKMFLAQEIQQAVIDVLVKKTTRAIQEFNVRSVLVGGGVSANSELRKRFKEQIQSHFPQISLFFPPPEFSTDNAVMVALTGYFLRKQKRNWKKIKAEANLKISCSFYISQKF